MSRPSRGGVLLIDKPSGPTSHDVVRQARRLLGERAVGHCGTLDPLASGLLVLVVGQATRLAAHASADDKVYTCSCQLGLRTDTDDIEGEVLARHDASAVADPAIETALAALRGVIAQVPPIYSAVHVNGQRAHRLARQGQAVALEPRTIRVDRLELVARRGDALELDIAVSKGGYVRALVRDLGEALGCGATVTALRRTRSGHLSVRAASTLDALESGDAWAALQSPATALAPGRHLRIDAATAAALWRGGRAPFGAALPDAPAPWLALTEDDVVGLVEPLEGGAGLRLSRGFPPPG